MPKGPKGRQGLFREEYNTECAEIYSPPRVTQVVTEIGLRAAWSLDLTTVDPEDGLPWDFNLEATRRRAIALLKRDKPLLFVACPMCGPFGGLQNFNCAKMTCEEVKEKLHSAMTHVKFALDMCLRKYRAGRFFVFEHPTSASSWTTAVMRHMMSFEGMHTAKFDFCQLGMTTTDAAGQTQSAKKRTTVRTNSANLVEVLRQAQRKGLRRHQHLVGGRASACQVHPQPFVELIT